MTTLSANKPRGYEQGDREGYPVVADDKIFEGAAVGENGSGYARPLEAGDTFLGFAEEKVDNTDGAAGDINVRVLTKGKVELPVTGVSAITANNRPAVYASDDDTFTTTATANSLIGYVSRFVSNGVAVVEFDAALVKAAQA